MLQWLKDLLRVYTWKEFWMVMSIPTAIMGAWFVFCFLLSIRIVFVRAIAIWSFVLILTLASVTVDLLRRKQGKK